MRRAEPCPTGRNASRTTPSRRSASSTTCATARRAGDRGARAVVRSRLRNGVAAAAARRTASPARPAGRRRRRRARRGRRELAARARRMPTWHRRRRAGRAELRAGPGRHLLRGDRAPGDVRARWSRRSSRCRAARPSCSACPTTRSGRSRTRTTRRCGARARSRSCAAAARRPHVVAAAGRAQRQSSIGAEDGDGRAADATCHRRRWRRLRPPAAVARRRWRPADLDAQRDWVRQREPTSRATALASSARERELTAASSRGSHAPYIHDLETPARLRLARRAPRERRPPTPS